MSAPPGYWQHVYDPALGTLPDVQGWYVDPLSYCSIVGAQMRMQIPRLSGGSQVSVHDLPLPAVHTSVTSSWALAAGSRAFFQWEISAGQFTAVVTMVDGDFYDPFTSEFMFTGVTMVGNGQHVVKLEVDWGANTYVFTLDGTSTAAKPCHDLGYSPGDNAAFAFGAFGTYDVDSADYLVDYFAVDEEPPPPPPPEPAAPS